MDAAADRRKPDIDPDVRDAGLPVHIDPDDLLHHPRADELIAFAGRIAAEAADRPGRRQRRRPGYDPFFDTSGRHIADKSG